MPQETKQVMNRSAPILENDMENCLSFFTHYSKQLLNIWEPSTSLKVQWFKALFKVTDMYEIFKYELVVSIKQLKDTTFFLTRDRILRTLLQKGKWKINFIKIFKELSV